MGKGLMAALAIALVAAAPAARPVLVLAGDGVGVGARTIKFDRTTRAQAIALVTTALGPPVKQGNHGDCAQDAIRYYAAFRGDFELTFVGGKFVGWTEDGTTLHTAKGIAVGSTLAAVRRAYPDVETDEGDEANGGLGASFQREDGPQGWLDGTRPTSKVIGLYAGVTCIVS